MGCDQFNCMNENAMKCVMLGKIKHCYTCIMRKKHCNINHKETPIHTLHCISDAY